MGKYGGKMTSFSNFFPNEVRQLKFSEENRMSLVNIFINKAIWKISALVAVETKMWAQGRDCLIVM